MRFTNECSSCRYLGEIENFDAYFCTSEGERIALFSRNLRHSSWTMRDVEETMDQDHILREAHKRAVAMGFYKSTTEVGDALERLK